MKYGAILSNRVIRINLFEDNRKLIDSFEYIFSQSEIRNLELELEKVIEMLLEVNVSELDLNQLGEKILNRYNLNGQAYALAIKEVIPAMTEYQLKNDADMINTAFIDAINRYWECYVLQPDPTVAFIDNLDQMVQDRIPRVFLAMMAENVLNNITLCNRYFEFKYNSKQKQVLFEDIAPRLLYALSTAEKFAPDANPDQRIADICSLITSQVDSIKNVLIDTGQWPAR
jgi:hypothetical protein